VKCFDQKHYHNHSHIITLNSYTFSSQNISEKQHFLKTIPRNQSPSESAMASSSSQVPIAVGTGATFVHKLKTTSTPEDKLKVLPISIFDLESL